MFKNVFPKIVPVMRKCGKIFQIRTGHNDNIIWRMCYACLITKVTDAHSEYVIIALSRQQWLRERASILHYITLPVSFVL